MLSPKKQGKEDQGFSGRMRSDHCWVKVAVVWFRCGLGHGMEIVGHFFGGGLWKGRTSHPNICRQWCCDTHTVARVRRHLLSEILEGRPESAESVLQLRDSTVVAPPGAERHRTAIPGDT